MASRAIPVFFYRSRAGNEPVRDWLRELASDDRRAIGLDLMRVQTQWPIGMPVCRSLGDGLWEVRSRLPGNRIARLLFFMADEAIYVVHGFIKKTQAAPASELALARRRVQEMKT